MSSDSSPREPVRRVPSYRRHKPTGQAVVTLNGRDIYLGKHGTAASRGAYDRLIGEWLAAGRCVPRSGADLTVAELAHAYWQFAKAYYRKDGQPSPFLATIRLALRHLRQVYGPTLARDFGPLAFQATQEQLVQADHSRAYVNKLCAVIRRTFKWGVSQELIPPSVHHALTAVPGLKKGRTAARETDPVEPVAEDVVETTLPHLPQVVADMVRFQRLTGCRPAEVCILRPCDLDRGGEVWTYRPASHKTEHFGHKRIIFIGPKAQAILLTYLLRDAGSFCFSPIDSEARRKAAMRADRKTKVQPSQVNRRKRRPKRTPGDRYTPHSYRRAIHRAVDLVNRERRKEGCEDRLPKWSPNRLRHSAATEIRKAYGLESVQAVLGHANMNTSEIYAERNQSLAAEVMKRIG